MIPPQLAAIGGGAVLIAGLIGGWTLRDWKADAEALAAAEAREALRATLQARVDAGARRYEQWRAGQEPVRVHSRNMIREVYLNAPPVTAACAAPTAVAGLLADQTRDANAAAAGEPGPQMRGAAAATAAPDRS